MMFVAANPAVQITGFSPGKKAKCFIEVTNPDSEAVEVEVQPEDWTPPSGTERLAGGVTVSPARFTLKGGAARRVRVTAKFREPEPFRVTQVFFASKTKGAGLNIGTRVGSIIKWDNRDSKRK